MANYGNSNIKSKAEQSTQKQSRQYKNGGVLSELLGGEPAPKNLKVPQKDLLVFFRQLAVILQSGVSLAQGLILIAENMSNKRLASCITRISTRLSAGEELSVSLRQYPKVFERRNKLSYNWISV